MSTVMDSIYPAGRFGETLNIVDGNSMIYELLGEYTYYPLYRKVCEKDHETLKEAVRECSRDENVRVCRAIRLLADDGEPQDYIITMQKCPGEDRYYIELAGMSEQKDFIERLHHRVSKVRDYLTLVGVRMFSYRPADKSFHLFWINYEQTIDIRRVPFEKWRKEVLEKGWVTGEDEAVFTAFCDTVEKLEADQTFRFRGSILTGGEREESYRVRFLTREHGGEQAVIGVWSVVDEKTGEELESLLEDSNTDGLTRLLNKKAMTEYAERQIEEATDEEYALAVIDIDNFKYINDTYGHMFGDEVISAVADVIKKSIGSNGVAGRIGGDEYMLLLKDYGGEMGLRNYLRTIKTNVAALFREKLKENKLSCSLGASRYMVDSRDYKELFKIADKALYIAKQKGKNRFIIYIAEKHGQFNMKEDGYDMLEIRDSFYSEKDMFAINRLLGEIVVHGREQLPQLLEQAAKTLMVDRITVFWGEELEQIAVNPGADKKNAVPAMARREELTALFQDDLFKVSNVNTLEVSNPDVCAAFRETGVHGTIQHLLRDRDGKVRGLIAADDCKQIHSFPKLAIQIFENMSRIINGVLIRD